MTADTTQPAAVAVTTEALTQTATALREWQWPIAQDAADLLDAAAVKLDASEAALAAAERERDAWRREADSDGCHGAVSPNSGVVTGFCGWPAAHHIAGHWYCERHAAVMRQIIYGADTPAPTPSGGEQPECTE